MLRERIYRVLVTRSEVGVGELARMTGVTRRYVYRVADVLRKRGVVVFYSGRVRLIDRRGLVLIWGMEKRDILRKYSIRIQLRPQEVVDLVLFSGTAALWILGRVLYPTMGTIYVSEDNLNELMKRKRTGDGYTFRVLVDNDAFRYTVKLRGYYKSPIIEQIVADAVAEGMFGKEALEYIE